MAIIYKKKKPVNSALTFVKRFGHTLPLFPHEAHQLEDDTNILGNARKQEKKLLKKCEIAFATSKSYKKAAKTYLTNLSCLRANMIDANHRRPIERRLSLHQIIERSKVYSVLKNLHEPVVVRETRKQSGPGVRIINDFGPVARAAQRMVVKLLRITYQPQDFQYHQLGTPQKIKRAMGLIEKEGYSHITELDIINYYPSFNLQELIAKLPLPKEAVEQIVVAKNAEWVTPNGNTYLPFITKSVPGIPLGSASSSEIAVWCIAHLKMLKVRPLVIINHADNFFLFSKAVEPLEFASKALSSGIAKLPGGQLNLAIKQNTTVDKYFHMLGCWVSREKGKVSAWPSNKNLENLTVRYDAYSQHAHTKLTAAEKNKDQNLRLEGLQDYLRLRNFVTGWFNAYDFCIDILGINKDYLFADIETIRELYNITDADLRDVTDQSTYVVIDNYSGNAHWRNQ